jgi:hypothetical protein
MKIQKSTWLLTSLILIQYILGCTSPSSSKILPTQTLEEPTPVDNTPSPLATNTSSPVPLTTTIPTLSPQKANQVLLDLYEDNGGCQLPCYWKITPGKTLWTDLSTFVSSVGGIYYQYGTPTIVRYDISYEKFDIPIGGISPRIWVEKGVVKAIGINSSWVSRDFDYSLSGLLQSFGVPEEIWIRPIAESSDYQPYYHLELFYPSKGIFVGLLGNAKAQGQYLNLCPQEIFSRSPFPPTLLLWNPKEQVSFDSNFGKRLVDDDLGIVVNEYRLLQEVAFDKLTNKDFYDIYRQPNVDACINVLPVR